MPSWWKCWWSYNLRLFLVWMYSLWLYHAVACYCIMFFCICNAWLSSYEPYVLFIDHMYKSRLLLLFCVILLSDEESHMKELKQRYCWSIQNWWCGDERWNREKMVVLQCANDWIYNWNFFILRSHQWRIKFMHWKCTLIYN